MRCLFFAVCLSSVFVFAQTSSSVPASTSAAQDPSAFQIMQQAILALAVSPDARAYRNFALSGNLSLEGSSGLQPITVLALGLHDFRFEIASSDGTTHLVVMRSDGENALRDEKGHVSKITRNARAGTEVPLLLLPGTLGDLLASAGSVRDLGIDTVNGRTVHHLAVARQFPQGVDPDGIMTAHSTIEFFIDAQNFLVLKIAHTATDQNGRRSIDRAVTYTDFRTVDGAVLPFSITETLGGQKTWSLTITSIDFNPIFQGTDFQL